MNARPLGCAPALLVAFLLWVVIVAAFFALADAVLA